MFIADENARQRLSDREGCVFIVGEDRLTRQIGFVEVTQPRLARDRERRQMGYTMADIAFHDEIAARRVLAAR